MNMELYFLDENLSITDGPVDEVLSAVWEERFFDVGTFRLVFPRSMFTRIGCAKYVSARGESGEWLCGRVEYVSANEDSECEVRGRLLEVLASDVIMRGGEVFTGKLSDVLRAVLEANLVHTPVVLAEDFCTIEDEVEFITSWKCLGDWMYATLKPYGASFCVKLIRGVPTLSIVAGRDRSSEGGEASPRALFSTSYGNTCGVEYERDESEMKNFAYVCGSDGRIVSVDKSGGAPRREIIKKANEISPDRFDNDEEYVSSLIRVGEEALSECTEAVCVFAECESDSGLVYGVDYALGDICDVADAELGLSFALRVTGAATVYEDGEVKIYPTFGDEIEIIKKLRSAE